jgi:hypothetical protein
MPTPAELNNQIRCSSPSPAMRPTTGRPWRDSTNARTRHRSLCKIHCTGSTPALAPCQASSRSLAGNSPNRPSQRMCACLMLLLCWVCPLGERQSKGPICPLSARSLLARRPGSQVAPGLPIHATRPFSCCSQMETEHTHLQRQAAAAAQRTVRRQPPGAAARPGTSSQRLGAGRAGARAEGAAGRAGPAATPAAQLLLPLARGPDQAPLLTRTERTTPRLGPASAAGRHWLRAKQAEPPAEGAPPGARSARRHPPGVAAGVAVAPDGAGQGVVGRHGGVVDVVLVVNVLHQ